MIVKWRGHASFLIQTANNKIITDPFDEKLGYPLSLSEADIVTCSHNHWDHNGVETIQGQPEIIRGTNTYDANGVFIQGFHSYHDNNMGKDRGSNTIFKITTENISILHCGDLGHVLSAKQSQDIGVVDILMVPVGGKFTVDAAGAHEIVRMLAPRIVIPMHYYTPHLSFKLTPVEEFASGYDRVIKKPFLEVKKESLEGDMKIIILDYLSG